MDMGLIYASRLWFGIKSFVVTQKDNLFPRQLYKSNPHNQIP